MNQNERTTGRAFNPSRTEARPQENETTEDTGCHVIQQCIACIWGTTQLNIKKSRETYVRSTLRELVIYCLFIIVTCIMTFGMTSVNTYYLSQVMRSLFVDSFFPDNETTFKDISNPNDVWTFLERVAIPNLFSDEDEDSHGDSFLLFENKLLGVPRLRQLRVKNDSCEVADDFKGAINVCFNVYSPEYEDKEKFGKINGTAWEYWTAEDLENMQYWGTLATYSGSGSYIDLDGNNESANADIVQDLKDNRWLRRGTRALFLDFTVYNANVNLFSMVKLVFEMPATGGVIPSWSLRTIKLLRYESTYDYVIFGSEIMFVFFVFYYMVEELLELCSNGSLYFKNIWNLLDVLVILLSLIVIGFNVYRTFTIDDILNDLLKHPHDFPDFDFVGYWQMEYNNLIGLTVFCAWIKIFKYISFNKTMTQLSTTLSRCSKDIGGFAVMFFIVFFAYAQLGYLLFGTQVENFNSFISSTFTLLRTILGDFDFPAIEHANRILGPLFFITYIFFVFFILLNMFLAIINDTYSEVKEELSQHKTEFEVADYLKQRYYTLLGTLGRHDKVIDLQAAFMVADKGRPVSYEQIRNNLKEHNFSDVEIETCFAKHDTDNDGFLSPYEVNEMFHELERGGQPLKNTKHRKSLMETADHNCGNNSDYSVFQTRVERLEQAVSNIVKKIDAVLIKLELMEKTKNKRRVAMSKILDTITEDDYLGDNEKYAKMEKLVRDELDTDDDSSKKYYFAV